jgi:phenylacetate-CoA ligase
MRSVTRLRTILDNRATVLCATPTYALRLAEVAAEEQINLGAARVRRIIVGGEPGGSIPSTRARIEQLWPGARVVDHHGMTEVGPVSYECPRRAGVLHIMEAAYLPEVIHPDSGLPVDAGETGELVLTNLGRDGSPLLRYRTGDVVRRANQTPCRCGSHEMALEGGILGRTDDMLIVRGVNLYPSAIEEIIRSCGAVAEFLVQVTAAGSLPEVSIQLEPADEDGDGLARRVGAALENAFGLRIPVTPAAHGSLPRFEGKARRWRAN